MGNVFRVINCDGDIEISIYKKANAVFKTNEYKETEDICIEKETINIFNLLKENQELKSQLKGTTHCFDEEEHEKLKKQLEKLQEEYIEFQEKSSDIQFELRDDRDNYYERLQDKYREQKEFIKWLEDYLKLFDNMCIDEQGYYDMLEEILNKYKEIIGENDE